MDIASLVSSRGARARDIRFSAHVRRVVGRAEMNVLYLVSGAIAFGLSLYLLAALLKPEWFE